ncbi:MAG: hypothetical protein MHM6MM_000836 [Cercozoa sp. M6MM]
MKAPKLQNFVESCISPGAIRCNALLHLCGVPRGVHTGGSLPTDEVVLRVPQAAVLSQCDAEQQHNTHVTLAAALCNKGFERGDIWRSLLADPSFFDEYLGAEKAQSHVLLWTKERLQALLGNSHTRDAVEAAKVFLRQCHRELCDEGVLDVSWDEFLRAFVFSSTRALDLPQRGPSLVLFADLFNHSGSANLAFRFVDDYVEMYTTRPVQEGEELCLDYFDGKVSAQFALLHYGFAPECAPSDAAVTSLKFRLSPEEVQTLCQMEVLEGERDSDTLVLSTARNIGTDLTLMASLLSVSQEERQMLQVLAETYGADEVTELISQSQLTFSDATRHNALKRISDAATVRVNELQEQLHTLRTKQSQEDEHVLYATRALADELAVAEDLANLASAE